MQEVEEAASHQLRYRVREEVEVAYLHQVLEVAGEGEILPQQWEAGRRR
jgi:hypothetical protein